MEGKDTAKDRIRVVPSVLPADFARLGDEVVLLEKAGVDRIQWDVMDGRFVPNLTFGPDVIAAARERVSVPFEAHLMVLEPERLLHRYVEAGCDLVIVHAESTLSLHRAVAIIRELGCGVGVALNPATPLEAVRHLLPLLDLVLVMTVDPGFGGQAYLSFVESKLAEAAALIAGADRYVELEVDGGVSPQTAPGAVRAGARTLVAGSALYRDPAGLSHGVSELRRVAEEALA